MPVYELTEQDLVRRCSACHSEQRLQFNQVSVGVKRRGNAPSPLVIPLPACACGASEFLLRAADNDPPHPSPGSFGHLHRLIVQELHYRLLKAGRLSPELADETPPILPGAPLDPVTIATWFPHGLKIELPKEEQAKG